MRYYQAMARAWRATSFRWHVARHALVPSHGMGMARHYNARAPGTTSICDIWLFSISLWFLEELFLIRISSAFIINL